MTEATDSKKRQAFSHWLRTGRVPPALGPDGLELKFNPWHDPTNGRFTFARTGQQGRRWGGGGFTGGGGGDFGGAGASGSWGTPERRKPAPGRPASPALALRSVTHPPHPHRTIQKNGYSFEIDAQDRTKRVSGPLTMATTPVRSRLSQTRAGGQDRLPTDDGGHYIAARFNGPADAFNHFAQDAKINRGVYRRLEDQWATAKRNGKSVTVKIAPYYPRGSTRPDTIDVWFSIDGNDQSIKVPNTRRESKHGK